MKFKMERPDLVAPGDVVEIREGTLPNSVYYYVIEPAVAMSGNFPSQERYKRANIHDKITGTVLDIEENPRGFYVVVELEEA
ncbi:MAG: hypothetical protein MJ113_00945 [Lachnospiraceae bacterium]|nr:hypothetical protein [Lachnospiraceae bacterium]